MIISPRSSLLGPPCLLLAAPPPGYVLLMRGQVHPCSCIHCASVHLLFDHRPWSREHERRDDCRPATNREQAEGGEHIAAARWSQPPPPPTLPEPLERQARAELQAEAAGSGGASDVEGAGEALAGATQAEALLAEALLALGLTAAAPPPAETLPPEPPPPPLLQPSQPPPVRRDDDDVG